MGFIFMDLDEDFIVLLITLQEKPSREQSWNILTAVWNPSTKHSKAKRLSICHIVMQIILFIHYIKVLTISGHYTFTIMPSSGSFIKPVSISQDASGLSTPQLHVDTNSVRLGGSALSTKKSSDFLGNVVLNHHPGRLCCKTRKEACNHISTIPEAHPMV